MIQENDKPAYIEFDERNEEDRAATLDKERNPDGLTCYAKVDFAILTLPGGKDVVERRLPDYFAYLQRQVSEGRFKQEWLDNYKTMYRMWKEGMELPTTGTPIRMCPAFSKAEVELIVGKNIRTVEDLATATEDAMRALGMGARELVSRAKAYLAAAKDKAGPARRISDLEQKLDDRDARISALERQIAELKAQMQAKAVA